MLYGRSDIQSITVSETGHRHDRKKGQTGPFELDCPECEAAASILFGIGTTATAQAPANPKTWSRSSDDAPLTEAEQAEKERFAPRTSGPLSQVERAELERLRALERADREELEMLRAAQAG